MRSSDMHCHILPGIDDGARDFTTSIGMLRTEASEGVDRIICTPHYKPGRHNASPRRIQELTEMLQERVDIENLGITLYIGNEILYSDETPELLEWGKVLTLADSDHVLIEFYPHDQFRRIRNAVYELVTAGFVPVIAHAERYAELLKHPEYVRELSEMGAMIQLNASSVTGRHGAGVRTFCAKLLKEGRVDFIATDAHDLKGRAPALAACRKHVAAHYGEAYADKIFYGNALSVMEADDLPEDREEEDSSVDEQ